MYSLCLVLLLLTSCSRAPLSVQTDYWGPKDLASYIIDTPDPRKQESLFGERIYISWSLTLKQLEKQPVILTAIVRLKNDEEFKKEYSITKQSGDMMIPVVGDDYYVKGGILSYQVTLKAQDELISESHHRFWVEKIKLES